MKLISFCPQQNVYLICCLQTNYITKFLVNCFLISVNSLCWKNKQESSSYSHKLGSTAWHKSLTQIKMSRGPKIETCGTPHKIFVNFETRFATSTVKRRSAK